MPPERFLTSVGWSLNGLINQGPRFREIPRVSVSDSNLEMTIRQHENSGAPLVIEGISEHHAWPTAMFDIQWLRNNSEQQIQVRNVRHRLDLEVTFTEFLDHIKSIPRYASADETSRWYAKDVDCPQEWKKWLDATPLIPRFLCPHGPADIMQNLPESARVETLMCYLGIGDTFTPCHKDLCASFGHNLMCYTEDDASAFWFMTDSSAAFSMATYFQSLGQELDLERHAMSIEEFAAAPCEIYITEQKAGDLVLVPPRSCHQVINHGGLTVKMSWSRLSIRSTQVALHHELPIYRRVCRAETYRIKSTIHHTLRRNTALLEDLTRGGATFHEEFRRQLANDMQKLLDLFREIIQDECYPDADLLDHVIRDFNHNVYDTEGYPAFSCDFCGSDIFVSFFCCKDCSLSAQDTSSINDSLHICPGCYAEGRTCGCGRLMDPVQCWPLQILYGDHDRAVRALKSVGVVTFNEVGDQCVISLFYCLHPFIPLSHNSIVLDSNATRIFEAGMTIRQWRTASTANKVPQLLYLCPICN
ncbi:hypothetical protein BC827DRAFT_1136369 [Russula dissimulans]|nr:hypothetical protein BC827DRAFT_1136369 [Russula dissimulans]